LQICKWGQDLVKHLLFLQNISCSCLISGRRTFLQDFSHDGNIDIGCCQGADPDLWPAVLIPFHGLLGHPQSMSYKRTRQKLTAVSNLVLEATQYYFHCVLFMEMVTRLA
jgi:hypothetical protein